MAGGGSGDPNAWFFRSNGSMSSLIICPGRIRAMDAWGLLWWCVCKLIIVSESVVVVWQFAADGLLWMIGE